MLLRRAVITAALATLSALPLSSLAQTVDAGGAKFESSADVGGQKLVLNGAGVRYRAIFKVYGAGLYLKAKADTPDAIIKMDGPKRVMLKLLRDVDGKDLGKAFTDGMEKNMKPEERIRAINGIFKFGEVFNEMKKAPSGTAISVDWVPNTGAQVIIDGKPIGDVIKEPEFYSALLRIWLGDKPADDKLKAAWLGQSSGR
jgi:Chalcone isomerase-like